MNIADGTGKPAETIPAPQSRALLSGYKRGAFFSLENFVHLVLDRMKRVCILNDTSPFGRSSEINRIKERCAADTADFLKPESNCENIHGRQDLSLFISSVQITEDSLQYRYFCL